MDVAPIIDNEQTVFHDLLATRTRPLLRLMCWGHDTGFSESPALWCSSRSSLRFFLSPTCWIAAWTLANYDSHDSPLITHLYKYLRLPTLFLLFGSRLVVYNVGFSLYFLVRAMKYLEGHSYWVDNFKSRKKVNKELVSGCVNVNRNIALGVVTVYSAVEC